jgi:hypothetical protein
LFVRWSPTRPRDYHSPTGSRTHAKGVPWGKQWCRSRDDHSPTGSRTHGGLTVGAPGCPCGDRRAVPGSSWHNRGFTGHGGLTPLARVLRCACLPTKSDLCDAHTHIRSRAAGVSPPWLCKPRLQLQCGEFPRFEFGSNAPHGGLTPPAPGVCDSAL